MLPKWVARKPLTEMRIYLKYGFARTRYQACLCSRCHQILNAGPNYQQKYCAQCGQRIDFGGMTWIDDETIGYERRSNDEQIEDRVV